MQVDVPIAIFKKQALLSRQRGKIDPDAEEKIVLISNRALLHRGYNQFISESHDSSGQAEEPKTPDLRQNSISPWFYRFLTFGLLVPWWLDL